MPIQFQAGQALPTYGTPEYKALQTNSNAIKQNVAGSYNPATKVTDVPMLSGANGQTAINTAVADHTKDVQAITPPKPDPNAKPTTETKPVVADNPAVKAIGGLTAEEAKVTGTDLANYQLDPSSGYYVPKNQTVTQTSPDIQYASEEKKLNDSFSTLMSSLDAPTVNLINAYKATFKQRVEDQKKANENASRNVNTLNMRTGISRYAPGQASAVLTDVEHEGLDKIKELGVQEAQLIAQAQQSLSDKKYNAFIQQRQELNSLRKERNDQITKLQDRAIEELKTQRETVQKEKDNIDSVSLIAAKNGATPEEIAKIKSSKTYSEAIMKAGDRLQTATGDLGEYLQYKRDTIAKGLVPYDYQSFTDLKENKESQRKIKEAIAINNAKQVSDEKFTASDKNQQKLEQQYRQVLGKEFSSRTGSLGVENAKVNQANHLNSLVTQYYDPRTGNYNVPKSQYGELVLGLANLISPTSVASDSLRQEINTRTAKGDLAGAISYVTGTPQNGSTQEIIKNFIDSIDRQAETAVRNREVALQNMRDQAPTDLEQSRIDKLNKSTEMVRFEGQDRISKNNINNYIKSHPADAETVAKLYEIPGATDQDIEEYLKAQGKI